MPAILGVNGQIVTQIAATVLWALLLILARLYLAAKVRRDVEGELKRRWIVHIRNVCFLALLVGLAVIWLPQLRGLALSIMAMVVAIVIASKELLMCISGSFVRASGRSYTVGDRIEVAGVRGDVIDRSLLTTRLLEIGPGPLAHQATGRTITLPNSVLLSSVVMNETLTRSYLLHTFTVACKPTDAWTETERRLLDAARAESTSYIEKARAEMAELGHEQALETPSVDPRISIHFPDPDRVELLVRLAVPARKKGVIQQAILRRAMIPAEATGA